MTKMWRPAIGVTSRDVAATGLSERFGAAIGSLLLHAAPTPASTNAAKNRACDRVRFVIELTSRQARVSITRESSGGKRNTIATSPRLR
jgi:hypothetical protein